MKKATRATRDGHREADARHHPYPGAGQGVAVAKPRLRRAKPL